MPNRPDPGILEALALMGEEIPFVASNYMDDEGYPPGSGNEGTWGVLDQNNVIRARCSKSDAKLLAWAVNNIGKLVAEKNDLEAEIRRLRRSI